MLKLNLTLNPRKPFRFRRLHINQCPAMWDTAFKYSMLTPLNHPQQCSSALKLVAQPSCKTTLEMKVRFFWSEELKFGTDVAQGVHN